MAISNGVQCPQLNSGLGTSHGWLSSMWIERSDTLIHALGYNTTLFAGQSEGWYVLILVPKKLEDLETFNAVLQRGAGSPSLACPSFPRFPREGGDSAASEGTDCTLLTGRVRLARRSQMDRIGQDFANRALRNRLMPL